jgi:opacity protein-like surface antigen
MNTRLLPLALLLFTLPALAQQPNDEVALSYGRATFTDLGDSPTIGLSYAHFWRTGIAARVGAQRSQEDFPDNQGDKLVEAFYATAEYHLFRNRLISPYVGGGATYGHARMHLTNAFTAEDSVISGFGDAGVDVNFTPRFAIGADVNYFRFDPDLGDRYGTRLDPITILGSVRYRF